VIPFFGNWQVMKRQAEMHGPAAHPILLDRPAVRFHEGGLLGNGGMGVVVRARPDAVVLHFGHNDVWDIRVSEKNREKLGTFDEIFARIKEAPNLDEDAWFSEYQRMARENYAKPYPRPMPCGSLLLGFDRRNAELLGYRIDISNGACDVRFLTQGEEHVLRILVDQSSDKVLMAMFDARGEMVPSPFNRVRLLPDPVAAKTMPLHTSAADECLRVLSFRQTLPRLEPDDYDPAVGHPKDKAFRLSVRLSQPIRAATRMEWHKMVAMGDLEREIVPGGPFVLTALLEEGLASGISGTFGLPPLAAVETFQATWQSSCRSWGDYWSRSSVVLEDPVLESVWYRNLYFLRCALRPGVTCPGLFANWSYGMSGTAWHGDYHLNYNVQQPFWVTFSSNHVDLHVPYVDLVDHLLPVSRSWAREYYGLGGAVFPHTAYPVDMTIIPYPLPNLAWEVCETPWAVQSLWWHYLYTQDLEFLKSRAFGPLHEAVLFLVNYMSRPGARGAQWGDDFYHVFPTVTPEIHFLRTGFDKNYDCILSLTLTRFVFQAFEKACTLIGCEREHSGLLTKVKDILQHFPNYPTAMSKLGEVWVSVPTEDPEVVVNTPNPLAPVFPGDEYGLHSCPADLECARTTLRNLQIEGGNELVFLNLQAARLGSLDLEKFKRQLEYCAMPNGTFADMVLQTLGRYADSDEFDFMSHMGIWFENFALPVVINECLLQSYSGEIRVFPNWPKEKAAGFNTLRAVGAFLVSSSLADGKVQWIEIVSEAGQPLRMVNPWNTAVSYSGSHAEGVLHGGLLTLETVPGETLRFVPAGGS